MFGLLLKQGLHSVKALFSFSPKWVGWEWARGWERAQAGLLAWNDQKEYFTPYGCIPSNKSSRKKGQREGICCYVAHLTKQTIASAKDLLFSEWLDVCVAMESLELIPPFALLVHSAFPLPAKLSLSWPVGLLTFHVFPLSSTPTPWDRTKRDVGWVFICWPGSTHPRNSSKNCWVWFLMTQENSYMRKMLQRDY